MSRTTKYVLAGILLSLMLTPVIGIGLTLIVATVRKPR